MAFTAAAFVDLSIKSTLYSRFAEAWSVTGIRGVIKAMHCKELTSVHTISLPKSKPPFHFCIWIHLACTRAQLRPVYTNTLSSTRDLTFSLFILPLLLLLLLLLFLHYHRTPLVLDIFFHVISHGLSFFTYLAVFSYFFVAIFSSSFSIWFTLKSNDVKGCVIK